MNDVFEKLNEVNKTFGEYGMNVLYEVTETHYSFCVDYFSNLGESYMEIVEEALCIYKLEDIHILTETVDGLLDHIKRIGTSVPDGLYFNKKEEE